MNTPSLAIPHQLARIGTALLIPCALATGQWTQQVPATSPSARVSAAMEFVPQNLGLILFGGGAPLNNGETWLYDGTTWSQLSPATSPSPRYGTELVYDPLRGVAMLYGGLASIISIPPPTSETWEWDGTNWTQATPATNAGPRYRYGACFDTVRGVSVMYGGSSTQLLSIPNAQTWEYDGSNWTLATTTGTPGPRERPAMCFHDGIGRTVLFGGYDGFGLSDETWIYDGAAGTWTQVALTGPRPAARNAAKMVYDAAHGVCVLVGGQDLNGVLSDTWTFDGTRWNEVSSAQPQTTRDHAMAFLPSASQTVRFGGFVAGPNTLTDETWTSGTGTYGAGCAGSNGVPTLRATTEPAIGQSWSLAIDGLEPAINVAFVALGLSQAPNVDLGTIGMPNCLGFVSPDVLLAVTGSAGSATWTWPAVMGPPAVSLYAQALSFDPTINQLGLTASNAVYATLTN